MRIFAAAGSVWLSKTALAVGRPANVCVVDPTATYTVDVAAIASKSKNSPYVGRTLQGVVRHTVFGGVATVKDGKAAR